MLALDEGQHTGTGLVGIYQLLQVVGQIELNRCRADGRLEVFYRSLFVAAGYEDCCHAEQGDTGTEYMFDIFRHHNYLLLFLFTIHYSLNKTYSHPGFCPNCGLSCS